MYNYTAHPPVTKSEERFNFGKNWLSFLKTLTDERVMYAKAALQTMLETDTLADKRFLDAGSGSGLSSLAARQLGATVHSFDYDLDSVACTNELKYRYCAGDTSWHVEHGSVLDKNYMNSLGKFDVVYAWGVLHHTGDMTRALELTADCVAQDGILFIALYNDQGGVSRRWLSLKKLYNRLPKFLRPLLVLGIAGFHECKGALIKLVRGQNPLPFAAWAEKKKARGMSVWHDWVDWCGGLPFEVARPDHVVRQLRKKGFILQNLVAEPNGWGCNEYVFKKVY
jgi:2-polyprenyl-6-hydroxyphenyl methylase/3-demethylubiquinone-9 3-methyltransferase